MHSIALLAALAALSGWTVYALPVSADGLNVTEQIALVPVNRGTTNPSSPSGQVIALAGGGNPNSPPPPTNSPNLIAGLQHINFLENLESNFFEIGIANLTKWGVDQSYINTVAKVAAQELIHVATAETLLGHFNQPTIPACAYDFPVTTADEFFALADKITSVGIGALNSLTAQLATSDPAFVGSLASVITVEARHDAFFRITQDELPNPCPFDTQISGGWALNLANQFIVPGSCPDFPDFTILPPMTTSQINGASPDQVHISTADAVSVNSPSARPQTIEFTFPTSVNTGGQLFVGWINQADVPVFTDAQLTSAGTVTTSVPPQLEGLAFAALVNNKNAQNVDDLTSNTLAGPAIVPVS
ncbi:MAG: hypothetical protein M1838_004195 [Thelocarpon superellum]|nr:MAG: hypothetical protein M1838_004195 [Thelocarpon superellum]